MFGILGELEEQPASNSDKRMIAMTINIINAWWYPKNGRNPVKVC